MYKKDIADTYTVFDKPQESGNHENTAFVSVCGSDKAFTVIGCREFAFSYHDFTIDALAKAKHKNELVYDNKNHLYIDYRMRGLGGHSCGPEPEERYELRPHSFEFAFVLYDGCNTHENIKSARTDYGAASRRLGGEYALKESAADRKKLL